MKVILFFLNLKKTNIMLNLWQAFADLIFEVDINQIYIKRIDELNLITDIYKISNIKGKNNFEITLNID